MDLYQDVVGEPSLWQEVEGILLYDRVFSKLNLKGIKIKINHRKILTSKTFTSFLNEYRINHATKLLAETRTRNS